MSYNPQENMPQKIKDAFQAFNNNSINLFQLQKILLTHENISTNPIEKSSVSDWILQNIISYKNGNTFLLNLTSSNSIYNNWK